MPFSSPPPARRPAPRPALPHSRQPRLRSGSPYTYNPTGLTAALRAAAFGLAIAVAAALCPPRPALAQGTAALPAGSKIRSFDIPAGPLDDALNRYARTAGVNLSYDPALLAGLRSKGLSGDYSIAAALEQLLAGTGIEAQAQPGDGYLLIRRTPTPAPPDSSQPGVVRRLPTVTVTAAPTPAQESATGYTVSSSSSASKLDLALKETPQTITIVTEKLVQDLNATSINEVLAYIPGVTVVENGVPGAGRVQYFSRGFAINSFQIDGVMTDGAAFGAQDNNSNRTAIGFQDAFLYERMDVIRGSTGLTTGQGDPSASLSLVRKRPLERSQSLVNLKYGRWDNKRAEVDLSTPVNASGSWRARVVATKDDSEAYIDRVETKGHAFYGITELDLTHLTTLSLGGTQIKRQIDGAGPHGVLRTNFSAAYDTRTDLGRSFNNATQWSYRDFDYTNLFATLDHTFGNGWQAVASFNRFTAESDRFYGVMGTTFYSPEWDVASYVWGREKYRNKNTAWDVYLKGYFNLLGRQHDFVIGANKTKSTRTDHYFPSSLNPVRPSSPDIDNPRNDYYWSTGQWLRLSEWNDGDIGLPPLSRFPSSWGLTWDSPMSTSVYRNEQEGIYASTRLRPTERLQVILGGRYGKGESPQSCDDPDCNTYRPDTFSPYAGLIYEFSASVNAYLSYARVEKPATVSGSNTIDVSGQLGIDPVEANTLETGIKTGFFENRLNLAVTYFTMTQDNYPIQTDYIVEDPVNPGRYEYASIGVDGYRIYGWELSAQGQITPNWSVLAGYVHQRQKVPFDLNDLPMGADDVDDFTAQFFFPKNSFKLFSSYDFGGVRQYTLGGGLTWQSAGRTATTYYDTATGGTTYWWQGSYALYTLMARWRFHRNAMLGINVSNLFDKTYFSNSSRGNYGAPRNITVSLMMQF